MIKRKIKIKNKIGQGIFGLMKSIEHVYRGKLLALIMNNLSFILF